MNISISPPPGTGAVIHRIDPSDIDLIATQPIDITSMMGVHTSGEEQPQIGR